MILRIINQIVVTKISKIFQVICEFLVKNNCYLQTLFSSDNNLIHDEKMKTILNKSTYRIWRQMSAVQHDKERGSYNIFIFL